MPKRSDIEKVFIIGSGPIQIGQAAEFDYSGSQACQALREEGIEVVLVNSNPATIMTDPEMADSVYIEPLEVEVLEEIIAQERPDGIAAGLGGQTALNLTAELAERGILDRYDVEVLGTPIKTIYDSEDRDRFKKSMEEIGESVARSKAVTSVEEAKEAAAELGLPVIVRPAYTLGGAGGGVAHSMEKLEAITSRGLKLSRIDQVLVEESVLGWKEFEYEVIRDGEGTCITVVNMENFDPMGIHTGESIVIAPSQTLTDVEHQRLRSSAIEIIRHLGVEGGCNIQFAVNSETGEYKVVEVNPRVSRSSALASKATGYPIARVAAKIAIGMDLDEIPNDITKRTPASFEPAVDYVVVKIPKWPFEKFHQVDRELTTQMKSTGEVMAIGRTLEEAFHKAVRSLDIGKLGFDPRGRESFANREEIKQYLSTPTEMRKFAIYDALRDGFSVEEISDLTAVEPFWLRKLKNIVDMEDKLSEDWRRWLPRGKEMGFTDRQIAELAGEEILEVEKVRKEKVDLDYKMVDTCAAEFAAETPYYYSTFEEEGRLLSSAADPKATADGEKDGGKEKVLILGAGPIRIGQGIEFDYCCVHAIEALEEEDVQALVLNNNPETVSTDYDTSDKLFFDPLTLEDVLNLVESERPDGVMVQFGGQTSVNLALPLKKALEKRGLSTKIYGTDPEMMDASEDREGFSKLLDRLGISQPENATARSPAEARRTAKRIGYPILVRPSYVLGGRAMEIIYDAKELDRYLDRSFEIGPDAPLLVDQFLEEGVEIDVDAVSDGEEVLIGGIMEHIEEAGVHSGDSACVVPPQSVDEETQTEIVSIVEKIARGLEVVGLINIQLAVQEGEIYVLEANPRSSRTIPYISKATGIPLAKVAAKVMLGRKLSDLGYPSLPQLEHVAVKEVVLPFGNLPGVDPLTGPEMRSTGEVMGVDSNFHRAFYRAQLAAGNGLPREGTIFVSVKDEDKPSILPLVRKLKELGYDLSATSGTAKFLGERGVDSQVVKKAGQGSPNILDMIRKGEIDLVINTPTKGRKPHRDGFKIRRAVVDLQIPYVSNLRLARTAVQAMEELGQGEVKLGARPISDYQAQIAS